MRMGMAADVMNRNVLTVREDMTLDELAEFLTGHEISGAPVVDRRGKPVGVVSLTDIADARTHMKVDAEHGRRPLRPGWEGGLTQEGLRCVRMEAEGQVADIMTPTLYTVPEDTPVCQLAKTMVAGRIHRLLVTRGSKIVGIVTSLDLLGVLCNEE